MNGTWVWWVVGIVFTIPLIFLLIANRTKIAGWFTGGKWKTALWWICGASLFGLAVWSGVAVYSHWDKVKAWPYWLYVFIGVPVLIASILWYRSGNASGTAGAKPSERFKKGLETGIALAKLALMLAITAVLGIFIVGPRYFWGEPSVIQVQQSSAPQAQVRGPKIVQQYPQPFTITAPVGTMTAPQWSDPVPVNGRPFSSRVVGPQTVVPMAVLVDGVPNTITPGKNPDFGAPKEIRYMSLTGFPLQISGTIE